MGRSESSVYYRSKLELKGARIMKSRVSILIIILFVLMSSITSFADPYSELTEFIRDGKGNGNVANLADNQYELEEGGFLTYTQLVNSNGLVEENSFDTLKRSDKEKLVRDMITAADNAVETRPNVNEDTKSSWLQGLQSQPGMGTRLLATLLQNTQPDFVTANRIYEPFSGPVGVVLGLGAVLIMLGITITMTADVSWIAIPMFRNFTEVEAEGAGSSGGSSGFKLISHEAISAVRESEGGGGGSSDGSTGWKYAIGIYLKRRVVMLVILGICLMYLIQGQIFVLVGMILDLFSGFVGF